MSRPPYICAECAIRFKANSNAQKFCSIKCFYKARALRHKGVYNKQRTKLSIDWDRKNPDRILLATAKHRARKKQIPFDLTVDDIFIPDICPILGIKLVRRLGQGYGAGPSSPSLDRIDTNKGYTKDNVHVISYKANAMKSNATAEELKLFATWIINNV